MKKDLEGEKKRSRDLFVGADGAKRKFIVKIHQALLSRSFAEKIPVLKTVKERFARGGEKLRAASFWAAAVILLKNKSLISDFT
ncbi:hypothetical protein [Pyramidobacter piscolens]|uniref:hypothetical protein n=1 Tax=Pyramidobacter piscolens TaxID=638849 RepID=UPI003AF81D06